MVRISIAEDGGSPRVLTLDQQQVTIGRTADNDLPLTGKGVSGRHCRLVQGPAGVMLEDLGSTNGTYVNGERVSGSRPVSARDLITIAAYQLQLMEPERPTAGPSPGRSPQTNADPEAVAWARAWEKIDSLSRDWIAGGRDAKALLRGAKLQHARAWLARGRDQQPAPKSEQREFILASSRAARLRMMGAVLGGGVLSGALAVGVIQVGRYAASVSLASSATGSLRDAAVNRPRTDTDVASAQRASDEAAARAEAALAKDPARAVLLAIEGLHRLPGATRGSPAERVFRAAVAQLRGRPLLGHEAEVTAVAMSPDGRWAVTGSADRSARLWDLQTPGAPVPMALRGHIRPIEALAITPDGRYLFTAGDEPRMFRWDLRHADPPTTAVSLVAPDAGVRALAVSGDGRWLVGGGTEGHLQIWDATTGAPTTRRLGSHDGPIHAVVMSTDGTRVVTASEDATGSVWHVRDGQLVRRSALVGHEGPVHDVALAPDGSWVLTGGADGTARLWDPGRRGAKVVLEGHEGAVTQVAVSSDSALGLTGGTDDRIMVWELTAAHPELDAVRFDLHEDDVTALITYGADGERAADARRMAFSASSDNAVRTWNLERKDEEQDSVRLAGHAGTVGAIAVSHDANWLLSGSTDHTARVWDHAATRPGGASKVARGHTGPVLSVAVTAAGRIVTGSADGTARLWDPSGGRVETVAVLAGHQGRVKSVAVSPDGSLAATGGEDGIVRLWDLLRPDLGAAPQLLQGHRGEINHVEFGPAGTGGPVVVSIGADRTARVWTPGGASGRVHVLQHPDEVNAMALDPQGRWLLTGSISRVTLWDLRAADPAKAARAFPGHEVDVLTVAIDPHARWAASSSADPLVMLWNLEAGGEGTRLRRHQEPVDALAFSPDGTRLATGSRDQTIRLWDLSSPDPDRDSITLTGHAQRIGTLAFTPDGQWLLSASYDGIVRAWDIRNTDEQAIIDSALDLAGHGQLISDLAVASDGRFVVTASYDDSARLWPLDPRDLIGLGCAKVGRSLTEGEWKQDFTGPYRAGCK